MSEIQLYNLFPTPVMRVKQLLDETEINNIPKDLPNSEVITNAKSRLLSHTEVVNPKVDPGYQIITEKVGEYLRDFGFLLFGENLNWTIKDMWTNVLSGGGHQSLHAHANSFISGVIYLTDIDPSAHTVFHNSMGGRHFVFSNSHAGSTVTPYSGDQWVASDCRRGDMILFPSYMLHAVPRNEGKERISIAFNALPHRLKSWDYAITFDTSS